jgi:hypothetical protein
MDDGLQDLRDAESHLGAGCDGFVGGDCQNVLELLFHRHDVGIGKVDFVDDWDDGQTLLEAQMNIGNGLGLHSLRGVDNEQSAFARCKAARNLVRKVDVSGYPGGSIDSSSRPVPDISWPPGAP